MDEALGLLEYEAGDTLPLASRQELTIALDLLNHHNAPSRQAYINASST